MNSQNARQAPGRTLLVLGVGLLGFVLAQTSVVPALRDRRCEARLAWRRPRLTRSCFAHMSCSRPQ